MAECARVCLLSWYLTGNDAFIRGCQERQVSIAGQIARSSAFRPAAEVWRSTMARIPTLFGRLVYVAALRDGASGRYNHEALAPLFAPEEVDRALRSSHQQVFQQWISAGLAEQKADLDEYLTTAGGPRYALPYRSLTPAGAREVERQLYLTDLETLLELLRFEGGASAAPGSSPRP